MSNITDLTKFRSDLREKQEEQDAEKSLQHFYGLALSIDSPTELLRLPASFAYMTIFHGDALEIIERLTYFRRLILDGEEYLDHIVYRDFFLHLALSPTSSVEKDTEAAAIHAVLLEEGADAITIAPGWFAKCDKTPKNAEMIITMEGVTWRSHEEAHKSLPPLPLSTRPLPLSFFEFIAEETKPKG